MTEHGATFPEVSTENKKKQNEAKSNIYIVSIGIHIFISVGSELLLQAIPGRKWIKQ